MKLLHLSDTHNHHQELTHLPEADIVVHSGDFCFGGDESEAYDFLNWFCDLPYTHKIFIAGNHDDCLYQATSIDGLPENVHYLCNSGVTIAGIKFYGVPMFMNDVQKGLLPAFFEQIPANTDILVTHMPPYSICDIGDHGSGMKHQGNQDLLAHIQQLHLSHHLFGHEHLANGTAKVGNTVFSNAAFVNNSYQPAYQPHTFII